MFTTFRFSDSRYNSLTNTWQLVAITGALLILSAILIFIMPELVAYLIATLLLWGGIAIVSYAFSLKKRAQYQRKNEFWEIL